MRAAARLRRSRSNQTMARMFDGAAARRLDFGGITTTATVVAGGRSRSSLRLATPHRSAARADKYRQLDLRRRRAQIAARHQLDLLSDE